MRNDEVYVSDITYVESAAGVHYLSLVTDAYTCQIKGYSLGNDMPASTIVKAFNESMKHRHGKLPLIHQSDRGSQYCSDLYQQMLKRYGVESSMTDDYDYCQNALAERVNGLLKQEFLTTHCRNLAELDKLVSESIDIYNNVRPHLSLGMPTPNQMYEKSKNQLRA